MNRILLLLLIFTFSCAERELQLPVTTTNDITEVLDVSPIYIFYDAETGEADFNRNNMISTTNWLVNIDKRLTLKQVLPHLQYLQEKRQGDGMHKNENAKNYFTCFNEETKNLSFIEFTNDVYNLDYSPIKEFNIDSIDIDVSILVKSLNSIEITSTDGYCGIIDGTDIDSFLKIISEYDSIDNEPFIVSYDKNLSFQDYVTFKTQLQQLKSDIAKIRISNNEFIHN